jgi:hypothetical protein
MGGGEGGGVEALLRPPPPLSSGQIFKDDVNGISSTSDICYMLDDHPFPLPLRVPTQHQQTAGPTFYGIALNYE